MKHYANEKRTTIGTDTIAGALLGAMLLLAILPTLCNTVLSREAAATRDNIKVPILIRVPQGVVVQDSTLTSSIERANKILGEANVALEFVPQIGLVRDVNVNGMQNGNFDAATGSSIIPQAREDLRSHLGYMGVIVYIVNTITTSQTGKDGFYEFGVSLSLPAGDNGPADMYSQEPNSVSQRTIILKITGNSDPGLILAHEFGHSMGLIHELTPGNLMNPAPSNSLHNVGGNPWLNPTQIGILWNSSFLIGMPTSPIPRISTQ